jgi:hypothetical protein
MMRRLRFLTLALLCGALVLGRAQAAAGDALEYQVKAAFLYNFAKFVSWPPAKAPAGSAAIVFCVLERDPIGETLDQSLRGKTIDSHELQVRHLARAEDMRGCHVAYLGGLDANRVAPSLEALAGSGVLSVYDGEQPQRAGVGVARIVRE